MNTSKEKFMRIMPADEPTGKAFTAVMLRIQKTRQARAERKAVAFCITALCAVIAFIPAVQYLAGQSFQSGFSQYVSLVFSDSSMAFANWKEVLLSIVESMPVMGIMISIGIVFVFIYSLGKGARYASSISAYRNRRTAMLA